jgi:hypothetical protein
MPEVQTVYLSNANLICSRHSSLVSDAQNVLLIFRFHSVHSYNSAIQLFRDHTM